MTTATDSRTGDSMGRTGDYLRQTNLPADYSIRPEYGTLVLRFTNVLLVGVLDPAGGETIGEEASSEARAARRNTVHHLVRAANHHHQARRLLSAELDEQRYGLAAKAAATARGRLARRDSYYAAVEAAVRSEGLDERDIGGVR